MTNDKYGIQSSLSSNLMEELSLSQDKSWSSIVNNKQFERILEKVSNRYGYRTQKMQNNVWAHARRQSILKVRKMPTTGKSSPDFEQEEKMGATELMKDKHMVERYGKYLNRCFFMTSDNYIKQKRKVYEYQQNPVKAESFFQRMQKRMIDQKKMAKLQKQNTKTINRNFK